MNVAAFGIIEMAFADELDVSEGVTITYLGLANTILPQAGGDPMPAFNEMPVNVYP